MSYNLKKKIEKPVDQCPNIRARRNTNIQYDRYTCAKEGVKEIREAKTYNIAANYTSQRLVIKLIWDEAFSANFKH